MKRKMTISYCNKPFTIFSDGQKLILITESGGKTEAIICKNPILTSYDINVTRGVIDVTAREDVCRRHIAGPSYCNMNISIASCIPEFREGKLTLGIDLFERLSIVDFMDIIDKKLELRKEN